MGTKKNDTDKKWEALAKQLFDEPTAEDSNSFLKDPDSDELKSILEIARQIDLHFQQKRFSADEGYAEVEAAIQRTSSFKAHGIVRYWSRIAAVAVVALLLGAGVYWINESGWLSAQEELAAVDDYKLTEIVLADKSVVTLNYGSHLSYPEDFRGKYREVTLEGEGFFEIQPNSAQPFIIHAGKANIQVLGTSFNVDAHSQNGEVSVVVETGSVQVSANVSNGSDEEIVLTPGEKGVLAANGQRFQRSRNTDLNFLAWKTHSFIFNKTSLKEVIEQLNKVYRVQISTADPEMERLLLTARFDDRPIRFILEVIAMTHSLEVDQTDKNKYLLTKN